MSAPWIVARGDQRFQAPDVSTLKEWLAAGTLHPQDQVWNPTTNQWIGIPELRRLIAATTGTEMTATGSPAAVIPSGNVSSAVAPRKGQSGGCRLFAVGCGGVILGIVLTLGVELWMVASGVQAFQRAFSGGGTGTVPSSGSDPASSQYDLSQCGTKRGWGLDPEDRDPGLRAACDKAREEMRQQEIQARNAEREAAERKSDEP